MLEVKLQYSATWCNETTHWKRPWCWVKIEGRRRRGSQRMRWLDGITDSMDNKFEQAPGVSNGEGSLACCSPRSHKELDRTDWLNWLTSTVSAVFCNLIRTRQSDFTFSFHFHALEKEMATHSSILAWRMDGGAAFSGVTQSRTRLKWLSSSSKGYTKCIDRYHLQGCYNLVHAWSR